MAVQKSKKSRSKRGMRRSHHGLKSATITTNESGISHRRHHMADDGTYRGKLIVAPKVQQEEDAAEDESN